MQRRYSNNDRRSDEMNTDKKNSEQNPRTSSTDDELAGVEHKEESEPLIGTKRKNDLLKQLPILNIPPPPVEPNPNEAAELRSVNIFIALKYAHISFPITTPS
ncbi:hypothetical protein AB6A40_011207 [Gnathostoma spinigerum]|uniref:Uncharacterized protein n=1 Tax=Gnathostoma spinigerum TaxID=75299 RepID=A0ABD6EXJ2_9BILA